MPNLRDMAFICHRKGTFLLRFIFALSNLRKSKPKFKFVTMGRGDRKTRRGKIFAGSYGKFRPRKPKNIRGLQNYYARIREEGKQLFEGLTDEQRELLSRG